VDINKYTVVHPICQVKELNSIDKRSLLKTRMYIEIFEATLQQQTAQTVEC